MLADFYIYISVPLMKIILIWQKYVSSGNKPSRLQNSSNSKFDELKTMVSKYSTHTVFKKSIKFSEKEFYLYLESTSVIN